MSIPAGSGPKYSKNKFSTAEMARRYNHNGNITTSANALGEKINEMGHVTKDTVIMDLGCGTGMCSVTLLKYAKKVIFLDPSRPMLDVLQETLDQEYKEYKNYEIINGKITDYHGEDCDIIMASMCIGYVIFDDKAFDKVFEHMKPGGHLYLSEMVPHKNRRGWAEGELEGIVKETGFINITKQGWIPLSMNDYTLEDVVINRFLIEAQKPLE